MRDEVALRCFALLVAAATSTFACGDEATGPLADPVVAPPASAGAAGLTALSVSPLAMTPTFSPNTHDYAVHCAAGPNALQLRVTATEGASVSLEQPIASPLSTEPASISVLEDQAVVVAVRGEGGDPQRYWIRCLPHDFPTFAWTRADPGTRDGAFYLLGNAVVAPEEDGFAMVLDDNATPVWYRRVPKGVLNVDRMPDGSLSYYSGKTGPWGTDPDGAFQLISLDPWETKSVGLNDGPIDVHELRPLDDGNRLVLAYPYVSGVDLTGLGSYGPGSTIADCEIDELDPFGNIVWKWRGRDHLDPVRESTVQYLRAVDGVTVVDVFHCNSVEPGPNGTLLVSARNMDAIFSIDKATGTVLWKLGGAAMNKDGARILQLADDPRAGFFRQHDARYLASGEISLFDNHTDMPGPARALIVSVDLAAGVARPVWQYEGTVNSTAMGSFRRYANARNLVGWGLPSAGEHRAFTEIDDAGNVVFDVSFVAANSSYRAVRVLAGAFDLDLLRRNAGHP